MPTAKSTRRQETRSRDANQRAPLRRGVARPRPAANDSVFSGTARIPSAAWRSTACDFPAMRPTIASGSAARLWHDGDHRRRRARLDRTRAKRSRVCSAIMDWLGRATCYHGLFPHFIERPHRRDAAARPQGRRRRHRRERLSVPGAALRAPIFRPRRAGRETSARSDRLDVARRRMELAYARRAQRADLALEPEQRLEPRRRNPRLERMPDRLCAGGRFADLSDRAGRLSQGMGAGPRLRQSPNLLRYRTADRPRFRRPAVLQRNIRSAASIRAGSRIDMPIIGGRTCSTR